jgi:hypothetical protein
MLCMLRGVLQLWHNDSMRERFGQVHSKHGLGLAWLARQGTLGMLPVYCQVCVSVLGPGQAHSTSHPRSNTSSVYNDV